MLGAGSSPGGALPGSQPGPPGAPPLVKWLEGTERWTSQTHPWVHFSPGARGAWNSHCKDCPPPRGSPTLHL